MPGDKRPVVVMGIVLAALAPLDRGMKSDANRAIPGFRTNFVHTLLERADNASIANGGRNAQVRDRISVRQA
jgi:hypothetical protein